MLSYRKIGGLHFIRIARLQFSFCIVRKKAPVASGKLDAAYWARRDAEQAAAMRHADAIAAYWHKDGVTAGQW